MAETSHHVSLSVRAFHRTVILVLAAVVLVSLMVASHAGSGGHALHAGTSAGFAAVRR